MKELFKLMSKKLITISVLVNIIASDETKKVKLTKKGIEVKEKFISKIIEDEKNAFNNISDKNFEIVNNVANTYLNELKKSFSKYNEVN